MEKIKRRRSLELLAGISPLLLLPGNSHAYTKVESAEWMESFKFRWSNSRIYCFEVFEAMPPSTFNYKPHTDSMTFSKIFSHIGSGLNGYANVLDGLESENERESDDKSEVSEYLSGSFDRFGLALERMNVNDIFLKKHSKPDTEPWSAFTIFDMITLGYNHTIHHIAQATVYLRLNNIVPPRYRF